MRKLSEQKAKKYELITKKACDFIKKQVADANAKGVIFGLSGGIDSAVIAALCKKAMGDNCLALIMPFDGITPDDETADGVLMAQKFKIEYKTRPIQYIARLFVTGDEPDKMITGNLSARLRAVTLYYEGQQRNYLVVGTDDKSEYLIGYFTKYGDGASDMLPIASLYKHEVRELGAYLNVPQHIVDKKSSANLWVGHSAAKEIGIDYDAVDEILEALYDDNLSAIEASKKAMQPLKTVRRIEGFHDRSEHKRNLPPIAKLKE